LNSPRSELKVSRNDGNVRCRVIFGEKLPKANASEPRRYASPALRCGVEMNPDYVHDHEGPQRWVRPACHRRRRMSVVTLATTGSGNVRTEGIGSSRRKLESCWSIMQPRPSEAGVPEGCSLGQNCRHTGGYEFNGDRPGAKKMTRRAGMEWTHLTRACRAATGRRGVTDSFERRSLSEEAERVRLELERSGRSIMAAGVVGTGEVR
jgi:hypothetical protein